MKRFFLTLLLFGAFCHLIAQKLNPEITQFVAQKQVTISINKSTDYLNFLAFNAGNEINIEASNPEEIISIFIRDYGYLFGVQAGEVDLRFQKEMLDQHGFSHLYYEQFYKGIPVFGGDFRLHYNPSGLLKTANGVVLPKINISVTPLVSKTQAILVAKAELLKRYETTSVLELVEGPKLMVYRKGLVQGYKGTDYLAYKMVLKSADGSIRTQILIDAIKGSILDEFTDVHSVIDREVYDMNLGNLIWQEGDAFPGALTIYQQNEVEAAGHTYYLFKNTFGWLSYDGMDATMKTIHNNPSITCPNANWNGTTTNFCTNTASDDVVGHEWGHAYTSKTSGLIYGWQSGALNESYSDIWGETVDLLNGYEDAGEDLSLRGGCGSSLRWMMGEDAAGFGGALRDMWSPTCKGDPGKVSDGQYYCGTGDSGGVHTNSGVNNHAYALLIDGGTYNGETITGLGFTKVAHIFWRSQAFYLTNTSDFSVQAAALESACNDLLGINLEGISMTSTPAGPSGEIITASDCMEVAEVNLAVEFTDAPACSFTPMLDPVAPAICGGATAPQTIFFDDFESGMGMWTVTQHPEEASTWDSRDWVIQGSLPDGRSGNAIVGPDPVIGDCNTDLDNGIIRLESPVIAIPGTVVGAIKLSFSHYASLESKWDGGNIKYNINGGGWNIVPSGDFIFNAYNDALNVSNDNPMAGETAFTGANEGSVSGSWGESQVNLTGLGLIAGDNIQLRWELGTDGCNGWDAWYVDDILVCSCEAAAPVELTFFKAKAKRGDIEVSWQTLTEYDNQGFYLERSDSQDGVFLPIHWVAGSGTINSVQNYAYLDKKVELNEAYYYRLAQIDNDGKKSYSSIETAQLNGSEKYFEVYPNPAKNEVFINLDLLHFTTVELELIDFKGRVLEKRTYQNNTALIRLPLDQVLPGIYLLKIKTNRGTYVEKIVVY